MAVMRRWRQKWGFSTTSQGTCLSTLKFSPVLVPDCLTIRHNLYHLLWFIFRSRSVYNLPNRLIGNDEFDHMEGPLWPMSWFEDCGKPLVSKCYLQEWGLSCGGTRGPGREHSLVRSPRQNILRCISHSLAQGWRCWDAGIFNGSCPPQLWTNLQLQRCGLLGIGARAPARLSEVCGTQRRLRNSALRIYYVAGEEKKHICSQKSQIGCSPIGCSPPNVTSKCVFLGAPCLQI